MLSRIIPCLALVLAGCAVEVPATPDDCRISESVQRVSVPPLEPIDAGPDTMPRPEVTIDEACASIHVTRLPDGLANCVMYEMPQDDVPCTSAPGRVLADSPSRPGNSCIIEQAAHPDTAAGVGWYLTRSRCDGGEGDGIAFTAGAEERPATILELRCGTTTGAPTGCE